jgi:hypothetical protein
MKIGSIVYQKSDWFCQLYVIESYNEETNKYTLNPIKKLEVSPQTLSVNFVDYKSMIEKLE